ncbi:MAG: DUF1015 domain-containing protein [Oscillospiraceae bacterium]|nr:DUF1015 domain-containing protein [Oscillospiraceae bacterium]
MSTVKPFKAGRPKKEFAGRVAALPYDVMNTEEAASRAEKNDLTFLRVDRAEIDFPAGTDIYSEKVYKKAAENLNAYFENGVCFREAGERFYIYRQIMGERVQHGIVGCAGVDDYLNGVIKRHELTRADKEEDRIRHVDTCNANTGPIFLAYRENKTLKNLISDYIVRQPEYDFISEGDVKNTVWVIDETDNEKIVEAFKNIDCLYIADGHHRAASAVKVALKRREEFPDYKGDEEFNFFLSVFFCADELKILDYNRLIKDTNSLTDDEMFGKISEFFSVEEAAVPVSSEARHIFGMYYKNKWYKLTLKDGIADETDAVKSLDVSILQSLVNEPIFGIGDPRTDKRIDFVGGIRGLKELEKRCSEDMAIAFSMYPTSIEELMNIADNGKIMPPKSTWFEPKLLSGLFIHFLS